MRLFQRISDILAANLNEMIDAFEDPETMLKQAIREMETSLDTATSSAARSIAGEALLRKKVASHEAEARRWRERAERAVNSGDDDRARRCLGRKQEHETLARALGDHVERARESNAGLRRQVDAMRAKLDEARRKLATLTARRRAADACRNMAGTTAKWGTTPHGFARFARLSHQLDLAEAEADACVQLLDPPAADLDTMWADLDRDAAIEAELDVIKAGQAT
jgi:phage shock protein A